MRARRPPEPVASLATVSGSGAGEAWARERVGRWYLASKAILGSVEAGVSWVFLRICGHGAADFLYERIGYALCSFHYRQRGIPD